MLDSSLARLNDAPAEERRIAEILALASLTAQLEENLIPREEAMATAETHHAGRTEEWVRAVSAALAGMDALKGEGYRIRTS